MESHKEEKKYPLTFPFLDELTEAFRFFEKFRLDCIGLSFWGCCLFSLALELGWFWKIAGLPIGPKGLEAIDMEAPLMRNTSIFRELFEKVTPRHFVRSMFRGAGLLLIFNLRTPRKSKMRWEGVVMIYVYVIDWWINSRLFPGGLKSENSYFPGLHS